ncbi:MAG: hypothetical protein P8O96_05775 [Flavobacteriaceae bacterium]|nr:hypothetical protein [Flavobacteriaceae bacterium]MDG1042340.1 hypothetical protein [Flavobacteriaceae bacterium]
MKTINLLAILSIFLIGCTETVSKNVTIETNGGKILNGPNAGATYTFASDKVGQLALNFSEAFVKKDLDFISTEHFSDSIFFYPEKGLEKVVMDLETGKKLIQAMHEPYDSITRWVYDVMPVIPSYDQELTVVMFPFTEKRYRKDGTVEKYRFYERHYIRNGKIRGVRKWSQEE